MEQYFKRILQKSIAEIFFKGYVLLLLGPRQVGKTTLLSQILEKKREKNEISFFSGDSLEDIEILEKRNIFHYERLFAGKKYIFIDEGQKIESIGEIVKLMRDHFQKSKQICITGSSAFHLLSRTSEPLTGRKRVFHLFPLNTNEYEKTKGYKELSHNLENFLRFGMYPNVLNADSENEKQEIIMEISQSYLYKDILDFHLIKNERHLQKLLEALALQVGSEVSLQKLASLISYDVRTVERYMDLLEKSYIIFRLPPFYTNKKKELSKMSKIYFYDVGVRNAILRDFRPLHLRQDKGALFENFCIVERLKEHSYNRDSIRQYFWKGKGQQEVDLIEEKEGNLSAFEIKWKKSISSPPSLFQTLYPDASFSNITSENIFDMKESFKRPLGDSETSS